MYRILPVWLLTFIIWQVCNGVEVTPEANLTTTESSETNSTIYETEVEIFSSDINRHSDYIYYEYVDLYYKFYRQPLIWYEAKLKCASEDAVLAMPRDRYEAETIKKIFEGYPSSILQGVIFPDDLFLGFHDHFGESEYVGIDGISMQYYYHMWDDNQPDNFRNEDCVSMRRNGKFNDVSCDIPGVFICQKGHTPRRFANKKCSTKDPAYVYLEETEKCYKLHLSPRKWADARVLCEAEGGYLAVINNFEEEQFLASILNLPENSVHYLSSREYALLGYHDLFKEGHFTTVMDRDLHSLGYVNWAPGQPDNFFDEDCGAMTKNGKLNDIDCDVQAVFFCEKPSIIYKMPSKPITEDEEDE